MQIEFDQSHMRGDPVTQALEQGSVCLRPPEWLPLMIDCRHTAQWYQDGCRSPGRAGLLSDLSAQKVVLLRRRSHQSHRWIVLIETPPTELLRHRVGRPEIH